MKFDFIGNDKNGLPVCAYDIFVIKGRKYKAIYCKDYDGALIWEEVITDATFFYNGAFLIDVRLIWYLDLSNATLDLGEDVNEEYDEDTVVDENFEEEDKEDYKSGYGIPQFKDINIIDKCYVQEEYAGQCYDELIENVRYFRKCINPGNSEAYKMDVIRFFDEEFGEVHAVILPNLPLSPVLLDTVGEYFA